MDERVLAVICRGTDFVGTRPREHAIPPTATEAIQRAKDCMREHNCSKVFLATEDLDVLTAFKDAFGKDLIYNDALRFSSQPNKLLIDYEPEHKREKDRYLRGLEYLTTLHLISRCDCLLGSGCSSFYYARYRNPKWDYVETIDNGSYD